MGSSATLTLGRGWYAHETYRGASFRWVDNDAELIVARQPTDRARLAMTVEAGPSLGTTTFVLHVLDYNRHEVASYTVRKRQRLDMTLPVNRADANDPYAESVFFLHVEGGGKAVQGDPRHLNFRVLTLADLRPIEGPSSPDIVDPRNFVRLGDHWYPVERAQNRSFRWANNDAEFFVLADKDQSAPLRVLLASGPGVAGSYDVSLRDAQGKTLGDLKGSGGGDRRFEQTVPLSAGENEFTLHINGGGRRVGSDPHRILNLRVFSIAAVR